MSFEIAVAVHLAQRRNVIDATRMPGSAADDPAKGQPAAASPPVPLQGGHRICAARGIETAPRRKGGADRIAIPPDG